MMVVDQEKNAPFKKTIEGMVPEDWSVKRLEQICSHFKSGFGITSDSIAEEAMYPVYGGNGLRGYTSTKTHSGSFILIGRQGALCGNIQRIKGECYISEHAIAVQTNENNSLDFLGYKLEFKKLNRYSESSAQPGLSVAKLLRLKIALPPLPEQRKIAEILSTWDEAIAQTKALIEQLKLRNKGLAQQLLTGKKRLKGFSGEWKEMRLEKYFSERNERGFDHLNLLSVGELGVYPQSESNKKDTSNSDKAKYKRICPGDIGYNTMRMWQGRSALSSLEGIVSPAYTIVTPKENADPNFFALLFKQEAVIHKFFRNSQGLVSDTLNCKFKDFKNVKVFVPMDRSEQSQIAKIVAKGTEEIKGLEQKMSLLKDQKKGLMQKLLTGEVRVKIDANGK